MEVNQDLCARFAFKDKARIVRHSLQGVLFYVKGGRGLQKLLEMCELMLCKGIGHEPGGHVQN